MNAAIKWTKWISGSLIIVLLLFCLHTGDAIQIKGLRNAAAYVSKFFISHPDVTFSILLLLCFIFVLVDVYRYVLQFTEDTQTAQEMKEKQNEKLGALDSRCLEIERQLNAAEISIKDHKYELRETCLVHHTKIHDCLTSLNHSYNQSVLLYHSTSKKLYHIASGTVLRSQKEIMTLIDQYQKIN